MQEDALKEAQQRSRYEYCQDVASPGRNIVLVLRALERHKRAVANQREGAPARVLRMALTASRGPYRAVKATTRALRDDAGRAQGGGSRAIYQRAVGRARRGAGSARRGDGFCE